MTRRLRPKAITQRRLAMSVDPVRPGPGETERVTLWRYKGEGRWRQGNVPSHPLERTVVCEFVPASVADERDQLLAEREAWRLFVAEKVSRAQGLAEAIRDMDRRGLAPGASGVPGVAGEIADLLAAALSPEGGQDG